MDQKKIGAFLRELRKEQGLTQTQLAEQFSVSDRTVSRWENGNNMPDLSLLIELADFYNVDIREITNGERKSGNMTNNEKDELLSAADYAEKEKAVLLVRFRNISIVGFCAMVAWYILMKVAGDSELPIMKWVIGVCGGLSFGAMAVAVLYSTGLLAQFRKVNISKRGAHIIMAICILVLVAMLIISIIQSI